MKNKICKMNKTDLPAILSIEGKTFREPWSERAFLDEMHNHESFCLFVEGKLTGYICGWKILDEYNITNLAIETELQHQGWGDLLVSYVLDLHKEDCSLVYLEVRQSNIAARNFYNKKGFDESGIRKNYYNNPAEDAVLMEIRFSN